MQNKNKLEILKSSVSSVEKIIHLFFGERAFKGIGPSKIQKGGIIRV